MNPAYTSQDCSACGHRQKLSLTERLYRCPRCRLELDRDQNASLNILALGLQSLGLAPRSLLLCQGEQPQCASRLRAKSSAAALQRFAEGQARALHQP